MQMVGHELLAHDAYLSTALSARFAALLRRFLFLVGRKAIQEPQNLLTQRRRLDVRLFGCTTLQRP